MWDMDLIYPEHMNIFRTSLTQSQYVFIYIMIKKIVQKGSTVYKPLQTHQPSIHGLTKAPIKGHRNEEHHCGR